MTKPSIPQSQKRFQESLGALFSPEKTRSKTCLFLKSSTDVGVIRNGGRNGARFAPQSFLSTFKRFSQNETLKEYAFHEHEVGNFEEEKQDFHEAQLKESERIASLIASNVKSRICHIGGGHDHVYPLLRALSDKYSKIIVLNIDAHADTRTDEIFHSGTPFRQFANEYKGNFYIFQIGLHPFANTRSTLSELEKGQSKILWKKDLSFVELDNLFKEVRELVDDKTLVLFSLDADALSGPEVPGVSAVNPAGLTRGELLELWERYRKLPLSHETIIGIYELNPLYDTLASASMRALASFVFETF